MVLSTEMNTNTSTANNAANPPNTTKSSTWVDHQLTLTGTPVHSKISRLVYVLAHSQLPSVLLTNSCTTMEVSSMALALQELTTLW